MSEEQERKGGKATEEDSVEARPVPTEPVARWAAEEFPWLPAWFGRRLPDRLLGEAGHFFDPMKIEEYVEDGALLVRVEIPGVDPDEDIDISVEAGRLSIRATRSSRSEREGDGYRSEFRYGSFSRVIGLPDGVDVDGIDASYVDGILEIRVPLPDGEAAASKKVPIGRG